MIEYLTASFTSALLTLFDLDRTFHVPASTRQKVMLYLWWWAFVVANGLIAAGLYEVVRLSPLLADFHPLLRALMVGASYMALIRIKFTTFTYEGRDVPFGLEALYEASKRFVYKRINRIAMSARYEETMALANATALADLATRTKLAINQNAILSPEEKRTALAWLLEVLRDTNAPESDKRAALADYILSGQRTAVR